MNEEKLDEIKVNVRATVNGESLEDYVEHVDHLIKKIKEARSLLEELTDEMASIRFEITD